MKAARATLLFLVVLLGVAIAADAFARGRHHHGRAHFGLFIGAPAFWYPPPYYYWPEPYPYYPRTVVVPASPPVYVEQNPPPPAESAPPQAYWYYCPDSEAYYPHVNQCASPWQRVPPRPPS